MTGRARDSGVQGYRRWPVEILRIGGPFEEQPRNKKHGMLATFDFEPILILRPQQKSVEGSGNSRLTEPFRGYVEQSRGQPIMGRAQFLVQKVRADLRARQATHLYKNFIDMVEGFK